MRACGSARRRHGVRRAAKPAAANFKGFALSLDAKDEADADRLFNALADGGKVIMPLGKTFFSPRFGMCADKFGVHWMVIVARKRRRRRPSRRTR